MAGGTERRQCVGKTLPSAQAFQRGLLGCWCSSQQASCLSEGSAPGALGKLHSWAWPRWRLPNGIPARESGDGGVSRGFEEALGLALERTLEESLCAEAVGGSALPGAPKRMELLELLVQGVVCSP